MNQSQAPEQVATYRQIRWTAMDILARREHSRRELQQKLSLRYPESANLIEEVICDLQMELLQSDERFTEAYVAMRRRKGYGPQRLQMELREKGIEQSLVVEELSKPELDWFAQAESVLRKKFQEPAGGMKERAKQIRFLQYRGFAHEHIQEAMRTGNCL
ncbi:regulatory protein RecX [Pseudomaricurvus sp.]|uniref:regulatory protein RecX n=1 Tax=Pseudomaricurvus sp. TaxID=2004510 RepID=UPI003F6A94BE